MSAPDYSEFVVISTNPRTLKVLTEAQRDRVIKFAEQYVHDASRIVLHKGGFDLPEGYVTCAIYEDDRLIVYYGISAEGEASS